MQVHDLIVEWDAVHGEWRCDLDDGHTVLLSKDLWRLELQLDQLEAQGFLSQGKDASDVNFDTQGT
jgi:hypothetical protein